MPPRLNKRQQREQEELAALKISSELEHGAVDKEPSSPEEERAPPKVSFAALMGNEPGNDSIDDVEDAPSEEEEPERKGSKKKAKRKKKKAPAVQSEPEVVSRDSPEPMQSKEQRKAAKKARQKEQARANKNADKDEIEKALEELSIKQPSTSDTTNASTSQLIPLLFVNANSLSPDAELRKFFGSRVVGTAPVAASKHKPATHRGILLNASVKGKSKNSLTIPGDDWAHPRFREGLTTEELDETEVPFYAFEQLSKGEKWYTMTSSSAYKSWTRSFVETVHGGDPTPFYHILQTFPYHAETLMQMAEIAAHREEHSTVSSFLERALYTYERALQVGGANVLSGRVRLDFDTAEARGLWLCIGRYVVDLLRRGCPSTAHHFSIILLSLEPYIDPYGALFLLDYTSIKAGKPGAEWFENMYSLGSSSPAVKSNSDEKSEGTDTSRWRWDCLPGWMYARALAARAVEGGDVAPEGSKSREYLAEAFMMYPELIPLVAAKAEIPLSNDLSSNKSLKVVTDYSDAGDHGKAMLHTLAHLYATRSSPLWKLPANTSFFTSVLSSTTIPDTEPPRTGKRRTLAILLSTPHSPLCYSIYRHILLASQSSPSGQAQHYKRLMKYFPKDVQNTIGRSFSFDPLPPATASSQYDETYWRGVDSGLNVLGVRQAAPNDAQRRAALQQLQAMMQDNPDMAQRFPGGGNMPQQLLDMLNHGEDIGALWEGLLAEIAIRGDLGGGGGDGGGGAGAEGAVQEDGEDEPNQMPGGIEPEGEETAEAVDEEEDGEEEDMPESQPSFFQSLFGRFFSFGGGGATGGSIPEHSGSQEHDENNGAD